MYEEMTYQNIMANMIADVPDGVDTSEGSLIYSSCAKCAMALEEFYGALGDVYDNIEVDTQDLDHLIDGGAESGCPITEATAATLSAQFNMALEVGTRLEAPDTDLTYLILSCTDTTNHIYTIESEDPGTDANSYIGEVEPIEYVDGFENGVILSVITAGTDQEDEEAYRIRRIAYYQTKPFAGNRAYYVSEIDKLSGVGGCKVSRITASDKTVKAVIIGSDYKVPTSTVIAAVQEAVDPSSGSGDGIAPIGASVAVSGCTSTTVNIALALIFASGVTFSDVKQLVTDAVNTYFTEIGKSWEKSTTALTVRVSQIEIRLLELEGIVDVTSVALNGTDANLTLADNTLPVIGEITCS